MKKDPKIVHRGGDPTVRFNGRTVELRVYINTDEGFEEVAERVIVAAKGPLQRMVCITVADVPKEQAMPLWLAFQRSESNR